MTADTPMHRETVTDLSDEELDATIDARRQRRERPVEIYKKTLEERRQIQEQRAKEEYDKQLRLFHKDLGTVDRALERIEHRANKLRALKIQFGPQE